MTTDKTRVLHIDASLFGEEGQSSKLAKQFVEEWQAKADLEVVHRRFAEAPIPHLTAGVFAAALTPVEERTPDQRQEAQLADELIEELQSADALVLGLPMYNFNIPSTLKAWFDHVARAGTTFRYTENGPEGLLKGKRAYVFAARGGAYQGTDKDLQTPYIRLFLGFLGITDVEFVYAEGMASDEHRDASLADAGKQISELAA